jgi:hypothetical protein
MVEVLGGKGLAVRIGSGWLALARVTRAGGVREWRIQDGQKKPTDAIAKNIQGHLQGYLDVNKGFQRLFSRLIKANQG